MDLPLIIPQKLKQGDTVGIIAPSKAPTKNVETRTNAGMSFLESLGLKIKFAPHVYDNEFYGGALIENRVSDIHNMFLDEQVKMIMMIVGGHYANLILPHLDYDLIRKNPKIFSGMSDGTLLTNAIYQRAGLQTYYGICLNDSIAYGVSDKMRENFINAYFNNSPIVLT